VRRRTRTAVTAVIAVLAAVLGAGLLGACGEDAPETPTVWRLPEDPSGAAARAGLSMLSREMLDVHYHAHLDVIVRDIKIQVPANIGIDVRKQAITALHTHDTTGIIHIESEKDIPFTLGQVFAEWGQALTAAQVGPVVLAKGEEMRVYVNGKRAQGDPAKLRLTAHAEIVVWVGQADDNPKVPSTYDFPEGV
jgi:hypothetical protein